MKKIFRSILLAFLLCFILNIDKGNAQERKVINDSIYSNVLKEQRTIKIKLPEEYKPGSDEKFEAIYLIDGEWNLDNFSFIHQFAKSENFVPPVILIAIPNTYINGSNMRDRDFLPENVNDNQLAGGANNFMAFIKNELIPYISKKYPVSGDNSLFGHSYGGLFTMYAFLKEPQLFNTYYCSDPSFWWNNGYMHKLAINTFEHTPSLDKTLWINGIESTYAGMGIATMDSILKTKAPKGLRWKMVAFPNETHNSVRLKGIYDGIKFVYDGYSNRAIAFHPMAGILQKDKPARIFMFGNYPDARFTTDGSEPNTSSPLAGQAFEITGPAKLTIKSFGGYKKYGATAKAIYEMGEPIPAIQKLKKAKSGGLKYAYYEGKWKELPDFSKIKPVRTGVTNSTFSLNTLGQSNFGCLFEGYFKAERDGYYIFAIDSDDGSKLFLNGKLIIDNNGTHGDGNYKSYIVPLQKGFYPIRIEYFQGEGGKSLQLIYLAPESTEPIPIPLNLFYN